MSEPGKRPDRAKRFSRAVVAAFRAYANWLVGISWKRFALLALLVMVASELLQQLPPFSWRVVDASGPGQATATQGRAAAGDKGRVEISIDEQGVRLRSHPGAASAAASAASAPPADSRVEIRLPIELSPATREAVREAVVEAEQAVREAIAEVEAEAAASGASEGGSATASRASRARWGDFLTDLAALWIVASIIIKITYKARMQAEAKAAMATETAESESLKRQVVEARLAAMQAQVEPHFLFNTLASIDHLIETDAPRASRMQKNLIALLRASMPALREAASQGALDLGHELAVIEPYLEILQVRMEERLATHIEVPEGLLSAEFPPMMLQGLVENAIKHGLEPKPEGGSLTVRAEIVHGKLAVSVADTGLGFGRSATSGTGVGLANIRERLSLLYGTKASLEVGTDIGGGARATITLPYRSLAGAG